MMNFSRRSRFVAAASPLAMATMLASSPAFAQDAAVTSVAVTGAASQDTVAADPAPAADAAPADDKGIVITGFRAALRSATAKKKNAETVVESVTAEDIGKLPDNSIAE